MRTIWDAIVIGAGVHGTSIAFHLARAGVAVLVLERGTVACEATGRCSGFIRMHYDLEADCRLAVASLPYFVAWDEHVGSGDPDFVRTGFLEIVAPDKSAALRANVAMQQRLGVRTSVVDRADVADMFPTLAVDDFEVAAFEPESGYADAAATAAGFLLAARSSGAAYIGGCHVGRVLVSGESVSGVATTKGDFHAPVVINAAGAWAAEVATGVGVDLPVEAWREHTAYFGIPSTLAGTLPVVIDDINVCSFRPEGSALLLASIEDANTIGGRPDRVMAAMPAEVLDRMTDRLICRVPRMIDGTLHSSNGGQDGMTPDQRPILGRAGPDGFIIACGFSGTGFKIAPAVGLALSELVVSGTSSSVDISAYGLDRFAGGRHLRGEHPYSASFWR
jgi:sarcosine oxidase subunit beta